MNDLNPLWIIVPLIGIWSCIGTIYNNSRKASKQLEEIVALLRQIAEKK